MSSHIPVFLGEIFIPESDLANTIDFHYRQNGCYFTPYINKGFLSLHIISFWITVLVIAQHRNMVR